MAHDDGYVHQAGRTSAQRRRRRAAWTMALVFLLLLSAFGIAVGFNQGWFGDRSPTANPTVACVPYTEPPPPQDITVNVYNATSKKGLAMTASQALAGQRFRIQTVSNDPLKKQVPGTAEIRYRRSSQSGSPARRSCRTSGPTASSTSRSARSSRRWRTPRPRSARLTPADPSAC